MRIDFEETVDNQGRRLLYCPDPRDSFLLEHCSEGLVKVTKEYYYDRVEYMLTLHGITQFTLPEDDYWWQR